MNPLDGKGQRISRDGRQITEEDSTTLLDLLYLNSLNMLNQPAKSPSMPALTLGEVPQIGHIAAACEHRIKAIERVDREGRIHPRHRILEHARRIHLGLEHDIRARGRMLSTMVGRQSPKVAGGRGRWRDDTIPGGAHDEEISLRYKIPSHVGCARRNREVPAKPFKHINGTVDSLAG